MKKLKHKIKIILTALCFAAFLPDNPAYGTIASVILTPANPTNLSNGLSYYLAGMTYNFTVQVIDGDITSWAQLTNVQITIPNSTNIVLSINPSGTGVGLPVTVSSGTVDADADVSGTFNNCTITFNVTIRWDTPESNFSTLRTMTVSVSSSFPAANTSTLTADGNYGVCSSIRVLNFIQDGVAADGMINPYHDIFHLTGRVVYNIPGVTSADTVADITAATTIMLNGVDTLITSGAVLPDLDFTIPSGTVSAPGNNVWRLLAVMSTAGGPESSFNSLTVDCDEVEITSIAFVNGGGINAPAYYRSVNVPGTEVTVTARLADSGGAMIGNTTVRLRNFTDNNPAEDIYVVIPNGSTTGTAVVNDPLVIAAAPSSNLKSYRAEIIEGGSYGGDMVNGQNVNGNINQPGAVSIYWDNGYYPWALSTPFTTWTSVSATAYSLTFSWTAPLAGAPNQDFYSYRVYYKNAADILYQLVDRNTTGYAALANSATTSVTIQGLVPLTNYDYYITAVDVFGQEVPLPQAMPAGAADQAGTLASTISVSLNDGISTYENDAFTLSGLDNPTDRPVRKTAINFKVFIVAAGDLPDVVNILAANTTTANLIVAGVINPALVPLENTPTGFYRISTLKTGSNTWSGYIPDTNPLIAVGTDVKFIVETIKDGVSSYADNNSETETPLTADPNDYPFTFAVTLQTKFTPWPTRVLNNVITSKNPIAYPAYYLTDDAYVSIAVYDIKGRSVKILLDNSFRKGGQNIKEGGWVGDNKSRNKVGIGLYYMHFKAKRASDGKVILDSIQKVVVAR
jgi:hypothetical protein